MTYRRIGNLSSSVHKVGIFAILLYFSYLMTKPITISYKSFLMVTRHYNSLVSY